MKETLLVVLRDRWISTVEFRKRSDELAWILARETSDKLLASEIPEDGWGHDGVCKHFLLVPILRAGLAILPQFLGTFADAPVGFVGIERDESTAQAHLYYKKLPSRRVGRVIVLDPMLATGGSAMEVIRMFRKMRYEPRQIYFTGVLGCSEGMKNLAKVIPRGNITLAGIDPSLDAKKYIVPGLGDYGDRYFGTEK